jgi:inorganic pyrophosphatase
MELVALIEAPKGCHNKYEFDEAQEAIWLDRTLFTATQFPADYGFIADTLACDGDPLDALVLLDEATFPGCRIRVRPIGILPMHDEAGEDSKLLCVPSTDPRWTPVEDIDDLAPFLLQEIAHFFQVYKQIEPHKKTMCGSWQGRAEAEAAVLRAQRRHRDRIRS